MVKKSFDWKAIFGRVFSMKTLLWLIFLALQGVLLPHTAWFYGRYEEVSSPFAWALAFSFEAANAAFVHKLSKHIEAVKVKKGEKFYFARVAWERYVNVYSLGLVLFTTASLTANILHAEAFASSGYDAPLLIAIGGGVLPFASLLFARVLSEVADEGGEVADEDDKLKEAQAAYRKIERENAKLQERDANLQAQIAGMQAQAVKLQGAAALWGHLNGTAQAACKYIVGEYKTLGEAASVAQVDESTISRLAKSLNHNGQGAKEKV
jgi:hypothetical protein